MSNNGVDVSDNVHILLLVSLADEGCGTAKSINHVEVSNGNTVVGVESILAEVLFNGIDVFHELLHIVLGKARVEY